jgi:uncharacterized membrane protein
LTLQEGLLFSAIAFVGTHFLLSHPLRAPLVRGVGERAFRGIYSLVALVSFGLMVYFYRTIGREPPLWDSGEAGWIIGTLLMWFASILFVGSFFKNPALGGAPGPSGGPAGVMTITRHPMLDGAIIILALGGAAAQDAKKARLMGEDWHDWTAQTAFIPFTRGVGNPGMVALIGGTLLFIIATWLHPVPAGFWRWIA